MKWKAVCYAPWQSGCLDYILIYKICCKHTYKDSKTLGNQTWENFYCFMWHRIVVLRVAL